MIDRFDMHCHLDFCPDPSEVAHRLAARGIGALSCTVTPAGYDEARHALAGCPNVTVGLGLHPWWIADAASTAAAHTAEAMEPLVASFEERASTERFLAEVGLDFAPRRADTQGAQLAAFRRVARCGHAGGKVFSLHAVRAAGAVLDVLAEQGALAPDRGNVCIFHWFSGTSDELTRAVRAGCLFSVNPRMLNTKRGRAYVRAIPEDRLLLETDEPPREGCMLQAAAVGDQLDALLQGMASIRGVEAPALAQRVARTSADVLAG